MGIGPDLYDKPFEHRRFKNGPVDFALTERGLIMPGRHAMIAFEADFHSLPLAAATFSGWLVDNDGALSSNLAPHISLNGGVASFSPGSTATNNAHYQWSYNSSVRSMWTIDPAKRAWLHTRFKSADVDKNLSIVGLHTSQTDPWATEPANQFLFRSLGSDGVLKFAFGRTNSTETEITLNTMADDTFYRCEAFYDGASTVACWVYNDANDLLASGKADTGGTKFPNGAMTIAFGMEMVDTGADALSIDYLNFYQER